MAAYEVDFSYAIREYGSTVVNATDKEEAEDNALNYVRDNYDQAFSLEIEEVKEVG